MPTNLHICIYNRVWTFQFRKGMVYLTQQYQFLYIFDISSHLFWIIFIYFLLKLTNKFFSTLLEYFSFHSYQITSWDEQYNLFYLFFSHIFLFQKFLLELNFSKGWKKFSQDKERIIMIALQNKIADIIYLQIYIL